MLCARLHRYLPWLNTHLYLWCAVTWNHTLYSKSHFSTLLNVSERIFGWTDAKINKPNEWANSDFITISNTSSGEIYTTSHQPISNQKPNHAYLVILAAGHITKHIETHCFMLSEMLFAFFAAVAHYSPPLAAWSNSKRKHKYLASICFLSAQYATRVHTHTWNSATLPTRVCLGNISVCASMCALIAQGARRNISDIF